MTIPIPTTTATPAAVQLQELHQPWVCLRCGTRCGTLGELETHALTRHQGRALQRRRRPDPRAPQLPGLS